MRTITQAQSSMRKPEPLAVKSNDARTAWPEHLDLGTIVQTHLS